MSIDRKVGARGFARALGQGRVCALAPDQRVQPRDGVLLDFLGIPAWTTILPPYLAGRRGSPMVPFYILPIDRGRYHVTFLPLLQTDGGETGRPGREWAAQRAQEYNDVIGEVIRRHPAPWLWMHTRWSRNTVSRWKSALEKNRRSPWATAGCAEDWRCATPRPLQWAKSFSLLLPKIASSDCGCSIVSTFSCSAI